MDEYLYLYAITGADCPTPGELPGVDPRFFVEAVTYGRVAAWASRVGLDQFDPARLQEGTMDAAWLSALALRHNEVVNELAARSPVLPMKLGTLFHSRDSLLAKVRRHENRAADFLASLGNRREWAVKLYFDESLLEGSLLTTGADGQTARRDAFHGMEGQGTHYLAAKRQRHERRQNALIAAKREISSVEAKLQPFADGWRRLPPLSSALTNRKDKMISNAAILLADSQVGPFQKTRNALRQELTPLGLALEVSGPWPPYHFCPSLES